MNYLYLLAIFSIKQLVFYFSIFEGLCVLRIRNLGIVTFYFTSCKHFSGLSLVISLFILFMFLFLPNEYFYVVKNLSVIPLFLLNFESLLGKFSLLLDFRALGSRFLSVLIWFLFFLCLLLLPFYI